MAGLLMRLPDYLASVTSRRWQYGELDCCTFMADWLRLLGYPDVMADRRGAYSTREEYRRLIRGEGGIANACRRRFAEAGLSLTETPAAGDVALVMAPVHVRKSGRVVFAPTGSICVSNVMRAVVTPDVGLVVTKVPTVIAWKVSHA